MESGSSSSRALCRHPVQYHEKDLAVEDEQMYSPGGFHPVHLGDQFHGGRFKVMHKLGHGEQGTVWLVRDLLHGSVWRALKIVKAAASNSYAELTAMKHLSAQHVSASELAAHHVAMPLETFYLEGPNGTHLCLVLPYLGPTLRGVAKAYADRPDVLKKLCRQLARAAAFVHGKGLVHGDFRPANALLRLNDDINGLSDGEMLAVLGEPVRIDVKPGPPPRGSTPTMEDPENSVPTYLVRRAIMPFNYAFVIQDEVAVVDFGLSFEGVCFRGPCMPDEYSAPETILYSQVSVAADIWAFGVTLCEVRLGVHPFDASRGRDSLRREWTDFMGPSPRDHLSTAQRAQTGNVLSDASDKHPPSASGGGAVWGGSDAERLDDLLALIFKWIPGHRISADDCTNHPWFEDSPEESLSIGNAPSPASVMRYWN